ncbi:NACHT domain-containing protein [Georgenia faecalis]|uniref:NACHT domain-containing protein n=1 Tax=Georgenia faecalis TaxID=2483799 RepID=UPI0013DEB8E9|nr:NACHT domain-containing protein [Georgenia faecalis]
MLEGILIDLGSSVARQIFEVKAREKLRSGSIQDFLVKRGHTILDSRKAERQFDEIAETVAQRLAVFLESEAPRVPEYEISAALAGVKDSFNDAEVDYQALLDVDLDASLLEGRIKSAAAERVAAMGLSDIGQTLYGHTLRECCNYVTDVALQVPDLHGKAFRELLQRGTELAKMVSEVLDRMPTAESSERQDLDAQFELQYRRQLARKLDELQLFGLTVSENIQRYRLTVAYISLSLEVAAETTDSTSKAVELDDGSRDPEAVVLEQPRLVIRGDAGSGKTTLLQWLAVTSARGALGSGEAESANITPFFLQLRRYVGAPLPAPSDFLAFTTPALSDAMPDGWAARQLRAGNGLLLIDGLDELPASERQAVADWISDLRATYPGCRFVVSSRPSGLSRTWAAALGFTEAELLPMSGPDISSFIEHWHAAAASSVSDGGELRALAEYERNLKALIQGTPPLRSLATSPLMCAMLCALHRDRRTQIPSDRVELYRVALETLLDRRDIERRVAVVDFELSLPQKLVLLQDVAYWFLLNDQSDAAREDVVHRIALRLASLRKVKASAADVFDYLLQRSGLLREPIVGRIDFLHRTFQEYLGALESVAQNNIAFLVDKASDDQWREVIVLACGLATSTQRTQMLRGLLERGDTDTGSRHVMHLMAVACLETAVDIDRDIERRVRAAMLGLVPPASMSDARAIASAGELAVPALRSHRRALAGETAACVRALALIGGESALAAIEQYAGDRRKTVFRELLRAWQMFDAEEYATRVIARSPLSPKGFETGDSRHVQAVRHLRGPIPITLRPARTWADLPGVGGSDHVVALDLSFNSALRDLSGLESLRNLRSVNLLYCRALENVDALRRCTAMRSLRARGTRVGGNLAFLPESVNLMSLRVENADGLCSFEGIERTPSLKAIHLQFEGAPRDFHRLASLESLEFVSISGGQFPGINALARPELLSRLELDVDGVIGAEVSGLQRLGHLSLTGRLQITDEAYVAIGGLSLLRQLLLSTAPARDWGWLPRQLRQLTVVRSQATSLEGMPGSLMGLSLSDASNLQDLEAIRELPNLRSLRLTDVPDAVDLEPLSHIPESCRLFIDGATKARLPASLAARRGGTVITIRGRE